MRGGRHGPGDHHRAPLIRAVGTIGASPIDANQETRRNIALKFGTLARLLRNSFDRQVAGLGVTRSQWTMIAVVSTRPGASQRVIAEVLEMSEASAGRLIDRLCNEGLLERKEREDDRRARAVYLTEKARPLLDSLAAIGLENEERMFRGFSEEELATLLAGLDRIQKNVGR